MRRLRRSASTALPCTRNPYFCSSLDSCAGAVQRRRPSLISRACRAKPLLFCAFVLLRRRGDLEASDSQVPCLPLILRPLKMRGWASNLCAGVVASNRWSLFCARSVSMRRRGRSEGSFSDLPCLPCKTPPFLYTHFDAQAR